LSVFISIGLCGYGCTALWFAGGAAAGAAGMHVFQQYHECPYCKKNIQKDATVCPYCQKDVDPLVDSN
jgi:predicted amidophosphoribosyltransferase